MFLDKAMKSGANVYYNDIMNSEMHETEKAKKDKDKERPELPIAGKWGR